VDSQIVISEKPLANVLKPNVRFGSKADMNARPRDVRFTLESRHLSAQMGVFA
jgi:hypothetical protein